MRFTIICIIQNLRCDVIVNLIKFQTVKSIIIQMK